MRIEILAHISASTTRQHDDEYRAQALAYLDFEPHEAEGTRAEKLDSSYSESSLGIVPDEIMVVTDSCGTPDCAPYTQGQNFHTSPFRSTGRPERSEPGFKRQLSESYGSFPTGVLPVDGKGQHHTPGITADSINSMDSAEPFSMHKQHSVSQGVFDPSTRKRIAQPNQHVRTELNVVKSQVGFSEGLDESNALFRDYSFSLESNRPIDDKQRHASISADVNHQGPDGAKEVNFRTSIGEKEVLRFVSNSTSEYSSSPARETQASIGVGATWLRLRESPASRPRPQNVSHVNTPTPVRLSIENKVIPRTRCMGLTISDGTLDFGSLPLQAIPPPPAVSTTTHSAWPSQSTTKLRSMVSDEKSIRQYNPKKMIRRLEVDERGFWKVDTAAWPRKIQYQFWTSMASSIQNGDFGWGITMHRAVPVLDDKITDHNELGVVRVYCWGELVEPIYSFIWLYSAGWATNAGLQWIDADDLVIIQMA